MERLKFIDCLRGMSMLFVVYHHIIMFGMYDSIDGSIYSSPINEIIVTVRMPLFFFVSGFVSARLSREWNWHTINSKITKKTQGQLIPTVVMFMLCMFMYNLNIFDWIYDPLKGGYWFTWVSFQIFVFWVFLSFFIRNTNSLYYTSGLLSISLVMLYIGYHIPLTNKIVCFLSFNYTLRFFIFFIIGTVCKFNYGTICRFINNRYCVSILFVIALIPSIYHIENQYLKTLFSIIRILCCFAIFQKLDVFSRSNILSNTLSYIGKHTLEIYLLHFFILFKVDSLALWLHSFSTDYCYRGHSCVFIPEILSIGILTLIISFTCIGIRKVIDVFPIISTMMFGPQKNRTI